MVPAGCRRCRLPEYPRSPGSTAQAAYPLSRSASSLDGAENDRQNCRPRRQQCRSTRRSGRAETPTIGPNEGTSFVTTVPPPIRQYKLGSAVDGCVGTNTGSPLDERRLELILELFLRSRIDNIREHA